MKIRNLTFAVAVSAGLIATQVVSAGSASALDSRPGSGVLKSQDGGATWAANPAPPSFLGGSYGVAEVDPTGRTIYVGTANGGVWKTTDGGASTDDPFLGGPDTADAAGKTEQQRQVTVVVDM